MYFAVLNPANWALGLGSPASHLSVWNQWGSELNRASQPPPSLQQPVVSGELSLSCQMFLAFIKHQKMKWFVLVTIFLVGLLFPHWLKATHEFRIGSSWTSGSAWKDQESKKIICMTLYSHSCLDGLEMARAGELCLYHCLIWLMTCRLCILGTAMYTLVCLSHSLTIIKAIAQPESYLKIFSESI